MSDRELLELAARAAGGFYDHNTGCISIDGGIEYEQWEPLTDDGDALRLAVKLSMHIQHLDGARESRAIAGDEWTAEGWESGKDVATRRVIVRAAAEIGRNMP